MGNADLFSHHDGPPGNIFRIIGRIRAFSPGHCGRFGDCCHQHGHGLSAIFQDPGIGVLGEVIHILEYAGKGGIFLVLILIDGRLLKWLNK